MVELRSPVASHAIKLSASWPAPKPVNQREAKRASRSCQSLTRTNSSSSFIVSSIALSSECVTSAIQLIRRLFEATRRAVTVLASFAQIWSSWRRSPLLDPYDSYKEVGFAAERD